MTDTTPLITGVDFVCIPAQDFDAMTTFYGDTLGLPFVKRYGNRPGAEYQAGNLTLAIMRTEDFGGTFSSNSRHRARASSARRLTPASAGRRFAWTLTAIRSRCTTATRQRTNHRHRTR